jgi:hypothetical protein
MGMDVPDDPSWQHIPKSAEIIRVPGTHYYAQIDRSFTYPFTAGRMVHCDADTVWLRRIDDALASVQENTVAGMLAHLPPPSEFFINDPENAWNELARSLIGKGLDTNYRSTISGTPIPFYPNYGFVIADAAIFSRFGDDYLSLAQAAGECTGGGMGYQAGLSMLMRREGLREVILGPEYNFANDPYFIHKVRNNCDSVRVIHYLRESFDRSNVFSDLDSYRSFLEKNLDIVESTVRARAFSLWGFNPPHLQGPDR